MAKQPMGDVVVLLPGILGSVLTRDGKDVWAPSLGAVARGLWTLGLLSVVGGLLGGWLLIRTSDSRFLRLLPWLMLAAAMTFTFGGRVTERLRPGGTVRLDNDRARLDAFPFAVTAFQLLVAIYGGYFGGGIGIMMLAALAVVWPEAARAQCALCRSAVQQAGDQTARTLNLAIVVLLIPPVSIFCAIFAVVYKRAKDGDPEQNREP